MELFTNPATYCDTHKPTQISNQTPLAPLGPNGVHTCVYLCVVVCVRNIIAVTIKIDWSSLTISVELPAFPGGEGLCLGEPLVERRQRDADYGLLFTRHIFL